MLADGVGWLYMPSENVARRLDLVAKRFEALGLGRFGLDATAIADSDARIVGPAVAFGRPATRVELAPKPADQPTKDGAARTRYELLVDNATFEIRETRTTVIDTAGVVMSEVITTVTRDELIDVRQIPSDFFRFSPPSGTRVL